MLVAHAVVAPRPSRRARSQLDEVRTLNGRISPDLRLFSTCPLRAIVGGAAMVVEAPSGTVSFLFTDIEGSTRLLHALGRERYGEVLREHHRLLREVWERHGGYEVDTEGDAFFVAFAQGSAALAAAAEAQRTLAQAPWREGFELRLRIGVHSGEASLEAGRYVGVAVHRAARICSAAHGGQVLVSEPTVSLCADEELAGVGLRDLGLHRLKDLTEPHRLYQLLIEGRPTEFPPPRTLENRPTNLPVQPTPLIGRERELDELGRLVAQPDVQLVTLIGPGGTGKTRLALQLAADQIEQFHDGVYFVALAPVRDPKFVVPSIVQTLAVQEQPRQTLAETLAQHLRDKKLLVVLDNFEQILDAAPTVGELLREAAKLKVVVTSRAPLHLSAEREFPVPPLPVPNLDQLPSLDALVTYEAVALFVERARAFAPDFQIASENASAIAEICARLDGLPLAIELAAARVRVLQPPALLARLDRRLKLLTGGPRDLPERQRTLRKTIEWSYSLLSEEEQTLFVFLSVFVGGCRIEAAEAVFDSEGGPELDVLDGLHSLVEKSLLRQRDDADGEPRFWMLQTIREYAAEQLAAGSEAQAVQQRFRRYVVALAEEAEPELWGGQEEVWLARLERENANLRATLGSAIAEGDAESALRLAASIIRFWEIRSRYSEAREWLSQALALDGGNAELRAKALMGVGRAARWQCNWSEAIEALEQSAAVFRDLHDLVGISRCLGFLGHARLFTGDTAKATDVLEENLATARETGNAGTIASALYNLAFAYIERRDFGRARELFEQAGRIFDSLDSKYGRAVVVIHIGYTALLAGDSDEATTRLTKGLNEAEEVGSPMWIFAANRYRALLALLQERPDEAEDLLAQLAHGRDEVAGEEIAHVLYDFAAAAAATDDAPRAARLWGAADAEFERLGLALLEEDRLLRDRFMPAIRRSLDDESWQTAWSEGHKLKADDAIAYALKQEPARASSHVHQQAN
jgi:predicted ATPase/class 3 adenylate cyclase